MLAFVRDKRYFEAQLDMAKDFDLPLFLHDRNTQGDFYAIMRPRISQFKRGGVLHSFTGSLEYMKKITEDLGLYIGVNGCSLKTEENINVVKNIPIDKLLIETGTYMLFWHAIITFREIQMHRGAPLKGHMHRFTF